MKNKKIIFLSLLFIYLLLNVINIGYSAFSTDLAISGDAIVRRDADIRIVGLELVSLNNGATERYGSTYSKSLTTMYVDLPNVNSSVTYRVDVLNKTGKYFSPNLIEEVINSNSNIRYQLVGIESYGVYQGSNFSFNIVLTTTVSNQYGCLSLKYNFESINDTTWTYDYSGNEKTFSALYNATYMLEVWGAQGGTGYKDGTGIGGYGAYARGNVNFNRNQVVYVNVGGEGALSATTSSSYSGGYNGGGASYRWDALNTYNAPGGGATHIATKSGLLSSLESYKGTYSSTNGAYDSSVILIVAAGGGGASSDSRSHVPGGAGGGILGNDGTPQPNSDGAYGLGGSQSQGGSFHHFGGTRTNPTNGGFGLGGHYASNGGSGGGGGFYGGGGASVWGGSGGGSSYIGSSLLTNKVMYCFKCATSDGVYTKTVSVEDSSSTPASGVPKEDNGYVKITLLPSN